ncbi:MAG: hypothetical protein ACTSRP_26950, partial [Candidatus Helarchaeota archaeon]
LLNKIFPILENSKSKLIKPEITYIIEEIKELLNENDIKFIISVYNSYNFFYSPIIDLLIENIIKKLDLHGDVIDKFLNNSFSHKNFFMLSIPLNEIQNPLLLGILYHEMGHALTELWNLLIEYSFDYNELINIVNTEFNNDPKTLEEIIYTCENWIKEIFADFFGLFLGGPCYYFSFLGLYFYISTKEEFLYNLIFDIATHPPDELRISSLENELNNLNFTFSRPESAFSQIINDKIIDPNRIRNDLINNLSNPLIESFLKSISKKEKIIHDFITPHLTDISSIITNKIQNIIFDIQKFNQSKDIHKFFLERNIPILSNDFKNQEISQIRQILNSCWYFYLNHFDESINSFLNNHQNLTYSQAYFIYKSSFDKLIYKSIELVYIWKKYRQIKDKHNQKDELL